jgi:hypothetical protein
MVRDPVSGVLLDPQFAVAIREHGGEQFYFATQEVTIGLTTIRITTDIPILMII